MTQIANMLTEARRLIAGGCSFAEAAERLPYVPENTRTAMGVLYGIDVAGGPDKLALLDRAIEASQPRLFADAP
jgi:hypothetical protein